MSNSLFLFLLYGSSVDDFGTYISVNNLRIRLLVFKWRSFLYLEAYLKTVIMRSMRLGENYEFTLP